MHMPLEMLVLRGELRIFGVSGWLRRWQEKEGGSRVAVNVNLTARDLQRPELVETIAEGSVVELGDRRVSACGSHLTLESIYGLAVSR